MCSTIQLGGTVCFKSQLSMPKYRGMASQKQAEHWYLHSPVSTQSLNILVLIQSYESVLCFITISL